ncbi:MAG: hypothetical protein SFX73_22645 [Kofleriaceae bacterium]|nr:hypothetical protein [Kofleriaceae bacterium]
MDELTRLKHKLGRELAQTERSAMQHCRREAGRLRGGRAADAMFAIAAHAEAQWPRLEALRVRRQPKGFRLGSLVGRTFSLLRFAIADRLIDLERSYRATLLGVHHGVGVVRLLAEVALRDNDHRLHGFCEEWLATRRPLIEEAEASLAWFAERPQRALRSGLRLGLERG